MSDYQIDLTSRDKQDFNLIERHKVTLRSVPATRFKSEYDTPIDKVEGIVKHKNPVRCVSTAFLARGFEDQSSGRFTLHHHHGTAVLD